MSQTPPMTLHATAATLHQMYQGMERVFAETRSAVRDCRVAGRGIAPAILRELRTRYSFRRRGSVVANPVESFHRVHFTPPRDSTGMPEFGFLGMAMRSSAGIHRAKSARWGGGGCVTGIGNSVEARDLPESEAAG